MNSTKIITGIGIFTAWALIVSILVTAFISVENRNNLGLVTGSAINPQTSSKIDNSLINTDKLLNLDEISKHNTAKDCWLLINNKVYDMTSYITSHPGGAASISSGCGKDATSMYNSIGHSSYADSLFTNYYVGNLNEYPVNKENSTKQESNNVLEDSNQSNSIVNNNNTIQQNNSSTKDNSNNNINTNKKYTLSVISNHNSANDCWLIINNKVYDMTSYITSHPGGAASISSGCGKDATSMYNSIGHSSYADSLFTNYYIGDFKKTIIIENTQEQENQVQNNTQNYNQNQNQNNQVQSNNNNKTNNNSNIPTTNSNKKYTLSEVSRYNTANNCYLIINNKVYDVTSYLFSHPAGSAQIIPYCGKEATSVYNAIAHSSYASSLLTAYNLGDISVSSGSGSTNPNPNPSTNPSTNPNPKPKIEDKENDDEDDKYQVEKEDKKEEKKVEDKEDDVEKEYEHEDEEDD